MIVVTDSAFSALEVIAAVRRYVCHDAGERALASEWIATLLSRDQLSIAQAEAEHVIQLGSVADDLGREPMTVVRVGRWRHVSVSPA